MVHTNVLYYQDALIKIAGKRTAFFAGTFDPFHNGHLKFIEAVLHGKTDTVVVCPHSHHTLKEPINIEDRIRIAEYTIGDSAFSNSIYVCHPSLLNGIQNDIFLAMVQDFQNAGREVFIMAGIDSVLKYIQPDLKKIPHFIHLRDGEGEDTHCPLEGPVMFIPCVSSLSSTDIRESLLNGECRHLPERVIDYIYTKRLYVQ